MSIEQLRKAFDLAHKGAENPNHDNKTRAEFRAIRDAIWYAAGNQPAFGGAANDRR